MEIIHPFGGKTHTLKTTFAGRLVVLVRMRGLEPPRGCPH